MSTTSTETESKPSRLRRRLKAIGWTVAWGGTLIVLGYAIENWLGARAWRAYVAEARAAGETLEPAAIIPPPVPDIENFAAIPLFQPLSDYERSEPVRGEPFGELKWRNPAARDRLQSLQPFAAGSRKPPGNWRRGEFADLAAWEEARRGKDAAPPPSGALGMQLLMDMAKFDPEMDALRAGASRPRSRFPVRYEDHVGIAVPHLTLLLKCGQIAQARAFAELSLGDTAAAQRDLLLGLRLADAVSEEPLLISHLVQIAQLELFVPPLWEGLVRHQWHEAELAGIESALARVDLVSGYQLAMRGERAFFGVQGLDALKKHGGLANMLMGLPGENSWAVRFCHLLPDGCIDFNKAFLGRYTERLLRCAVPPTHRFLPEVAVALQQQFEADAPNRQRNPHRVLAAMAFPSILPALERSAAVQATIDLARCAVALERHRWQQGALPATLEELAPTYLAAVPCDVTSGEPLRYRRGAEGNFELYSVGWNGQDDGGAFAWKKSQVPSVEWKEGDWPWPQPTVAK